MARDAIGNDAGKIMLGSNGFCAVEYEVTGLNTNFVFEPKDEIMIEFLHTPLFTVSKKDEVSHRTEHRYYERDDTGQSMLLGFIAEATLRIRNARKI